MMRLVASLLPACSELARSVKSSQSKLQRPRHCRTRIPCTNSQLISLAKPPRDFAYLLDASSRPIKGPEGRITCSTRF
eukprot:3324688-Pleurochrysis_carterae.AAC.1